MEGTLRRVHILKTITSSSKPISATALAQQYHVSRQIIVGDIALLRAAGHEIFATPRGYLIQSIATACSFTIACVHQPKDTRDELYAIVDAGGTVLDVIVEHPVYGQLCGQLNLHSRNDVDDFMKQIEANHIQLLSSLTEGIHLHRITCEHESVRKTILAALQSKGYLYDHQQ
ncbi:HTH domain-containing protein [Clostridiaceae bacterium DONG20-135]|uniref:HTH domain-containing protein n=1 Tax=Copranaerobaculum intestinale TaxID=2692629 RepID=A0A6N8U3Q0_9FIRM|nr:transcription repressor NadR [Copranaerobaculum intestinale]MXQ72848.1 HTH domain-containing protein [Copranaerobaculum intestinale]